MFILIATEGLFRFTSSAALRQPSERERGFLCRCLASEGPLIYDEALRSLRRNFFLLARIG